MFMSFDYNSLLIYFLLIGGLEIIFCTDNLKILLCSSYKKIGIQSTKSILKFFDCETLLEDLALLLFCKLLKSKYFINQY